MQNSVGIYLSGALLGYALLQKKDKETTQTELGSKIDQLNQDIKSAQGVVSASWCCSPACCLMCGA